MEGAIADLNPDFRRIHKTYVVLPAYNEAAALALLIPKIIRCLEDVKKPFEILVVNDGSSDETSSWLKSLPADAHTRELRHETNQGYGFALKTAFLWTLRHADAHDAAVTLDADTTHDPEYIPRFLAKLEEGYDVVTASYVMEGGKAFGVPWLRRLMSAFLNAMFHYALPLKGVRMYTNGFRGYRMSAMQRVHRHYGDLLIEESGFPGGTEFFLKLAGMRGRLTEIPFDLHYERRGGASKIHFLPTIRRYLGLLVKGRSWLREARAASSS